MIEVNFMGFDVQSPTRSVSQPIVEFEDRGHCSVGTVLMGNQGGVSFFLAWIRDEGFGFDRGLERMDFLEGWMR